MEIKEFTPDLTKIMRKEIPILYQTEMVQAILEGRKTMTRRTRGLEKLNADEKKWVYSHNSLDGHVPRPAKKYDDAPWYLFRPENSNAESWVMQCPYGKPGDVLWVREKWRVTGWDFEDAEETVVQYADGTTRKVCLFDDVDKHSEFLLNIVDAMEAKCDPKVDEDEEHFSWTKEQIEKHMRWKPSIHMPKNAARIWLEVVSVKVERLHSISEEDAKAEGVESFFVELFQEDRFRDYQYTGANWKDFNGGQWREAVSSFKSLWHKINGKESWDLNPWVWVVEFKRVDKPKTGTV